MYVLVNAMVLKVLSKAIIYQRFLSCPRRISTECNLCTFLCVMVELKVHFSDNHFHQACRVYGTEFHTKFLLMHNQAFHSYFKI